MIEIRQITKNYDSGENLVRALRGVSLTIASGEFTAIAGPSGSGKTTLLNLIGCIDRADSGSLFMDGHDVSQLSAPQLSSFRREKLGFIFQNFHLIPVLTALENVALALQLLNLPSAEVQERSLAALAEVGLQGLEHRLPTKLSGGQQQRVAVARALVKRPLVVLADEPTANLDSETGRSVLELMRELNQVHGTTFIFSTHDPLVMALSRRVIRLHDGMILEDNPL